MDKGYLVAVGELGAEVTLGPDLARKLHLISLRKAELLKKGRLVRQAKYGRDTNLPGLVKAGLN